MSHHTAGKTLPGKEVTFNFSYPDRSCEDDPTARHSVQVDLFVDMGVGIGGDTWPAAELFCDFISSNQFYEHFQQMFLNKTILELGSGNGLVSIMIEKCFQPKQIVVTDMESHIALIDHNLVLNKTQHCVAESLDWFHIPADSKTYDILLALECVYKEELFEPLIQTIASKSHEHTITILGMTRAFVSPKFFAILRSYGFRYTKIPHSTLQGSGLNTKHDIAVIGMFLLEKSPFQQS